MPKYLYCIHKIVANLKHTHSTFLLRQATRKTFEFESAGPCKVLRKASVRSSSLLCLPLPQRQQSPHISDILQALQQRHKMQQLVIRGIADPAFNGYRIICPEESTPVSSIVGIAQQ